MSITFDPAIKSATGNSYVSVDRSNNLIETFGLEIFTTWKALSNDKKEFHLMKSTNLIEFLWLFDGTRRTTTQKLSFPRSGLYFDGQSIDYDTMPEQIEYAVCYLAINSSNENVTDDNENEGLKSLKVGSVSLVFDTENNTDAEIFSGIVEDYLSYFGVRRGGDNPEAVASR